MSAAQGNQCSISHFLARKTDIAPIQHINVVINWQLSKQGIRWPVSPDRIAGSGVVSSRLSIFLKLSAHKLLVFKWLEAQVQFFLIHMKYVVFYMSCTIKILISNWRRKLKLFWLFSSRSRVGHALRPIFILWLVQKFGRWVHEQNLCSILNLVYFDSWSWQSFVSTWEVFTCLFPLNVQGEIQLLSTVFCYSWLVCLLGFWLRNTSLWQSRKADFGWHPFLFFTLLDA